MCAAANDSPQLAPTLPASMYTQGEAPATELWLARRLPFHYGYVVLIACGVGLGMSGPGQTTTFGVLVGDESDPTSLMRQTGVSRTGSSALFMVATFASAATMLRVGFVLDRVGPMIALSTTAVLLGCTCLVMSFVEGPVTLFVTLYFLRLFGQGCMMLIPPYTVNMWWVERRGFAYAITLSIGSIGINYAYPMLSKAVMDAPGNTWREALRLIGAICFLGTLPLGLLFFRARPEQYGLHPDAVDTRSIYRRLPQLSPPSSKMSNSSEDTKCLEVPKFGASKGAAVASFLWYAH
jgi:MFS family permease